MGELVRGKALVAPTAKTTTGTGTAVSIGAAGTGQRLVARLHVIAKTGGGTLDVILQSDSAEGMGTPTTRITFDQVSAVGSQTKILDGPITDTWFRESRTITSGSFTYVVSVGVAGVVGIEPPPLGEDGAKIFLIGASYLSFQGAAGVPDYVNVNDIIMQSLPQTAEFTMHNFAYASRSLQTTRDELDTEVFPLLHATLPNIVLMDGGAGLNQFIIGNNAAQILAIRAGIASDLRARPEQIFIGYMPEWGFPDAGWATVRDALNTALETDLATYGDFLADFRTILPTLDDVDGDGGPNDNSLFENGGSGNHPRTRLARSMSNHFLVRAKATVVPGLPLVLPDGYRIESDDTGHPTSIFARKGRISPRTRLIAQLGGVDLSTHPTTPRPHQIGIDDDSLDFYFDGTASIYETPATQNHIVLDGNTSIKPTPNEFYAMALLGASQTLKAAVGEDYTESIVVTHETGADVPYPWLQYIAQNYRVDTNQSAGTADEKDDRLRLWEGHVGLTQAGANFTSLRDAWGRVIDFTVLAGTPTVSDDTVDGRTVKTIVLGAADEITYGYSSWSPVGIAASSILVVKAYLNFAAGAGGEFAIEEAGGNIYSRMIGGATNLRAEATGMVVADLAGPTTPRVGAGGNSWRLATVYWEGIGGGYYRAAAGIEGQGALSTGLVQNFGLADAENGRIRIKGPCSVRLIAAARYQATDSIVHGSLRFNRGLILIGSARYGTTTAA